MIEMLSHCRISQHSQVELLLPLEACPHHFEEYQYIHQW